MLHRIDEFLLDRIFQPICDALYHRVGDCFAIAQICLIGSAAFGLLKLFQASGNFMRFAQLLYLIGIPLLMLQIGSMRTEGANPLRFLFFMLRVGFAIWLGMMWSFILAFYLIGGVEIDMEPIIRDLLLLLGFYFASCSGRPPKRQWVPRLTTSLQAT